MFLFDVNDFLGSRLNFEVCLFPPSLSFSRGVFVHPLRGEPVRGELSAQGYYVVSLCLFFVVRFRPVCAVILSVHVQFRV